MQSGHVPVRHFRAARALPAPRTLILNRHPPPSRTEDNAAHLAHLTWCPLYMLEMLSSKLCTILLPGVKSSSASFLACALVTIQQRKLQCSHTCVSHRFSTLNRGSCVLAANEMVRAADILSCLILAAGNHVASSLKVSSLMLN